MIQISKNTKRAVVLGGSVSGLKTAEKLFNMGFEVAIVESGERIIALEFDKKVADLVACRIEEAGILLKCGVSVNEIICDKDGLAKGVLLSDKSFLEAGVIVATESFLSACSVIRTQMAEVPNCIAVSDSKQIICAKYPSGNFRNIPMNSFVFYGMALVSVGEIILPENADEYECNIFYDEIKHSYRKLVFRDSRLVGYILIGDIDFAGVYTSFITFECELDTVTKIRLCDGCPDILMWPDELFFNEWTP
nr:FAD-dependent oxidoreductase [Desulfovibrio gilichinskyi]